MESNPLNVTRTVFSPSNSISMSEDVRELMKALLLAETDFGKTGLANEHPQFKTGYAKVGDFYGAVKPHLIKNNIKITHFRHVLPSGEKYISTRLIHTLSGQWIQDMALLVSEKPGNQGLGAATTYMIKDAIRCLCAIAATEDDDGADEDTYIQEESNKLLTGEQIFKLQQMLRGHKNSSEMYKEIIARSKCKELYQILKIDLEKIEKYINETKQPNA